MNIKLCSRCPGNTEYYCLYCKNELCLQCKETHAINLDTKDHIVILYKGQSIAKTNWEMSVKHKGQMDGKHCEPCNVPVCVDEKEHSQLDKRTDFLCKRKKQRKIIKNIESEILYRIQFVLEDTRTEHAICRKKISNLQLAMKKKSEITKEKLDGILDSTFIKDIKSKVKRLYIKILGKQQLKKYRHILKLVQYEQKLEKTANRPVKFFRFIRKCTFSQVQIAQCLAKTILFSVPLEFCLRDLLKHLSEVQLTESKQKRRVGNDRLLTLVTRPLLKGTVTVNSSTGCLHISILTPSEIVVSIKNFLFLADTKSGSITHCINDPLNELIFVGYHATNNDKELFYISKDYEVIKLSYDMKTKIKFVKAWHSDWKPQCLCCSTSTGELLVGMRKYNANSHEVTDADIAKINRYNLKGDLKHTIQHDHRGRLLYRYPSYIVENNNGDVVVSDFWLSALVVTRCDGRHRFSYSGTSRFSPRGICTDVFSNILVCDFASNKIHLINKDGKFLSYIQTTTSVWLFRPRSLSYDCKNHLLWIGTDSINKCIHLYRYINRHIKQEMSLQNSSSMTETITIPSPADILYFQEISEDECQYMQTSIESTHMKDQKYVCAP
uniref:Uncharacterized protein LOC111113062 isoform X2 n=1 Tax=Crassostrea virginica TaxID=6565 RepID=A0A8B8BTR5_CRAVI|nr:uncharacterized protein LOC111113062 isoform X2 [Crassostrea virginica]